MPCSKAGVVVVCVAASCRRKRSKEMRRRTRAQRQQRGSARRVYEAARANAALAAALINAQAAARRHNPTPGLLTGWKRGPQSEHSTGDGDGGGVACPLIGSRCRSVARQKWRLPMLQRQEGAAYRAPSPRLLSLCVVFISSPVQRASVKHVGLKWGRRDASPWTRRRTKERGAFSLHAARAFLAHDHEDSPLCAAGVNIQCTSQQCSPSGVGV